MAAQIYDLWFGLRMEAYWHGQYVFYFMLILSVATVFYRFKFLRRCVTPNNVQSLTHCTDVKSMQKILHDRRFKSYYFGVVFATADIDRLWQARSIPDKAYFIFCGNALRFFKRNVLKNKILPFFYPVDMGRLRVDEYQTKDYGELLIKNYHIENDVVYVTDVEIVKYSRPTEIIKMVSRFIMSLTKFILPGFVLATVVFSVVTALGVHISPFLYAAVYFSILLMPIPQYFISICIGLRERIKGLSKKT
ncbi:hypothetical protein ACVPTE_23285 [Salmonella enterica subsp. enterica serovar Winslow]